LATTRRKKKKAERPEGEILFPEKQVAGYTVKPWTLGQIEELSACFERVAFKCVDKGVSISLDKLEAELPKIIGSALPEISTVLSVTIDGLSVEDAKKFDLETATLLILTVVHQNMEYLKNSLGPINIMIKQLIAG